MSSKTPPNTTADTSGPTLCESRKRPASPDERTSIPSRVAGTYQRRKASNACLVCRARKTKCDNVWPVCGFCKSTGGECQYTKPNSQKFDQASAAILKQLDHIEGLLKAQAENHQSLSMFAASLQSRYNQMPGADLSSEKPCDVVSSDMTKIAQGMDYELPFQYSRTFHSNSPQSGFNSNPNIFRRTSNANDHLTGRGDDIPPSSKVLTKAYSEMGIEAMLEWPIFQRSLSRLGAATNETLVEMLGQINVIESASNDSSRIGKDGDDILSLDSDKVQHLIENFLVNNNLKNPVLEPSLLRKYGQEVLETGLQWDGKSCLLLLILAISSLSTSLADGSSTRRVSLTRNQHAFQEAEVFFEASQRRIGVLYCENSLISTQCAFLSGVYLMYTLRVMAAWKSFVQAGTQCLAYLTSRKLMNFQANPTGSMGKLVSEPGHSRASDCGASENLRALEDGLYWSCLKSEVELRLEIGLPGSGINESSYPHIFPSPPNFEELESDLSTLVRGARSFHTPSFETDRAHLVTGWFFYLGEIALKRLMNRILLYRYGDNCSRCDERPEQEGDLELRQSISEFDLQLEQWMHSLPAPMRFSPTSTEPLHDILRWVLRGHRIDIIELLRFPALSEILNPVNISSFTDSANHHQHSDIIIRLAGEYLANAAQRISTNAEGFLHRHQGSWLTIRSCTRSALTLLGAKLKSQEEMKDWAVHGLRHEESNNMVSTILPPGWKHAVLEVIEMLRAWEAESPDVGRLRVIVEGLLGLCSYE